MSTTRTLAIGDIHGCLTALETMLEMIDLQPEDTLITLGDYVDRGPDVKGVIDRLIQLKQSHHVVTLRGNHEIAMLRAREDAVFMHSWMAPVWGGGPTLNSYQAESFDSVPEAHWNFLNKTLPYHESDTHIFVHANLDPEVPLSGQSSEIIYWERFDKPRPHLSGKTMICGHTSQQNGVPRNVGHSVCIDTFVYGKDGWLTCLNVESGDYWQSNEAGETRQGQI